MAKSESARPTASLRAEHATIMSKVQALAERIETLHEQTTLDQFSTAREVVDFVRRQIAPHAHAEEYTLYPAADWAAGEGSKLTEPVRFEHVLVSRRCDALEKAIGAGAAPGKLMHLCYGILGLVAAHFVVTEEVILPYLDKAFDGPRFEKEVLTPLRETRKTKR
ncbi:MAG TPA: hemerythrin domain-containing protein [Candidatus Omnitrophota bacterium]|jgi:hemerythrin-like domain-containing protein|nr:hemerythrin domain-containing protein [Candidatus Omnitrophota bacterium]